MEYKCTICNKLYSSYQSLWIHNKKFHEKSNSITAHNTHFTPIITQSNCKYCKKKFTRNYNAIRHEKTCKNKVIEVSEITELKKEITELKNMITTKNTTNNKIINTTNNNNNGTINNITNNFVINKIGEESISKLKFKDIKNIFREQKNCLYHAIKYVNFNDKIPENHAVCIEKSLDFSIHDHNRS